MNEEDIKSRLSKLVFGGGELLAKYREIEHNLGLLTKSGIRDISVTLFGQKIDNSFLSFDSIKAIKADLQNTRDNLLIKIGELLSDTTKGTTEETEQSS